MKKLFFIPIICILALTFCLGGTAYAQKERALPDAGITPDSPFYFADKWSKQLTLIFTFKAENKVNKSLQYAKERLAEMDSMLARNKFKEATEANNEYQNCLDIVTEYTERSRNKGIDTSETVVMAASEYLDLVSDSMYLASENAQELLIQTRERTRTCQETALRTLAQDESEEAIRLNLMLMERQLNRINANVDDGQATRLHEALQEYERLANLGEEISQIAGEQGKGTTTNQLTSQATDSQLQALTQAQQRFQKQSLQVVNNSTQNCIENQVRVATRFQTQNQTGQIQENNTSTPTEIQEKSKQHASNGGTQRN
jgi:hypothetical protein